MKNIVTRAIILDATDRVLLGLRAPNQWGANQWALIGGKPNLGEIKDSENPTSDELKTTIIREVKEELGLDFQPEFVKEILDKTDTNKPWTVFIYKGLAFGEPILDINEITEIKYFNKNELEGLDLAFNHRDLLNDFFNNWYNLKS